jgi:hypothetical protein
MKIKERSANGPRYVAEVSIECIRVSFRFAIVRSCRGRLKDMRRTKIGQKKTCVPFCGSQKDFFVDQAVFLANAMMLSLKRSPRRRLKLTFCQETLGMRGRPPLLVK